jgi:DNA-directed RNA polymerase subunit beta'
VDLSFDAGVYDDDVALKDVVLDDRTARAYELEGGFDVFPPDAFRAGTRDVLEFGRTGYGVEPSDDAEGSYSPILDDEDDLGIEPPDDDLGDDDD